MNEDDKSLSHLKWSVKHRIKDKEPKAKTYRQGTKDGEPYGNLLVRSRLFDGLRRYQDPMRGLKIKHGCSNTRHDSIPEKNLYYRCLLT